MKYIKAYEEIESHLRQKLLDKELLKYSSKKSALQNMRKLISAGANVNYYDINDGTPLIEAAKSSFYSGLKLLIDNGADVNIKNRKNQTALLIVSCLSRWAIKKYENNVKNIVDLLIINDADMNAKDTNGNDMFDYFDLNPNITNVNMREYIKNKFPEQYNEYLIKKDVEKYNI